MASTVRLQPIPSEISTFPPPLSPVSTLAHKNREDGHRERQRRGSVASTSSRRALPGQDSCLLSSEKTNKEYSDASRRRPASICSALGGANVDSIISTLRAGAEKRMTSGMGLREQEQHMVKIGRENWALKIDVTMLKKKRDELGTINERLTRQVETLSRENRELKRDLKRTKEDLEKRERELDEACRMYEKLGATSVVLEELSKKQHTQQHQRQLSPEEYILEAGNYGCPKSPIVKVEGSRPSSRLKYSKSPQSASQAPEFWGPSVRASGRVSPSPSVTSTTSTRTGISRSGFQSPLPNKNQVLGLPFLSSPSVSTCCSLRRIPIPRHVESDDEENDSSSEDDMPTPNPNEYSDDESDHDSDLDSECSEKEDLKKSNKPQQSTTPKANMTRVQIAKITPPSSNASAYTKRGSFRRKILKFNREEEPDTSDYSSGEEDMFDSDVGGSTPSSSHTLTPMTASPEPNKTYLVPENQDKEWKPRATALAAVAKRVSYVDSAGGDREPIVERSAVSNNVPFNYRQSMFDDYSHLQLPEQVNSAASSMVNANTRVDRCQSSKSRIPVPSTTSAVVQRRRKHLDSLSRLVVAREVLSRKMLQA